MRERTIEDYKAAGYIVIGEWGDHLHGYRAGWLLAAPAYAERIQADYDNDLLDDDATLEEWYRERRAVWVAA